MTINRTQNRGFRCRCLGRCGKQILRRRPWNGLCPRCGEYCAPATIATDDQSRALATKNWKPVAAPEVVRLVEDFGLQVASISDDLKGDLRKIAKRRNDPQNSDHLFAHRHIIDRPGLANGDFKSKQALRRALNRTSSVPKFLPAPDIESAGVMGKLIEAELEFRANRRRMASLSMVSRTICYEHPALNAASSGPITVEIDGRSEDTPVELKTVATMETILRYKQKIRDMLMQLAGQALASGVDSGILLIAEREGELLTAIQVGGLRDFHIQNIRKWMTELDIKLEQREQEVAACG